MARYISNIMSGILAGLVLSAACTANASNFGDAAAKGVKILSVSETGVPLPDDLFVKNLPNAIGVSYNDISAFVVDRPLKIINTGSTTSQAAKLIIIKSPNIDIHNKIEIVGSTADLLIISNNPYNNVNCVGCSFKNIGRVTLAIAEPTLDANYTPSMFTLVGTGALSINGLSTDTVASTEFIAKNIVLDGKINTQEKGSYTDSSSFVTDPNGNLVIGAGGVNVFAGFNIDYSTLALHEPNVGATLTMPSSALITSQAVHIATAAPFIASGNISTKSDANSVANYRGKLSAIEEVIEIYSLSDGSDISLNGSLQTDNIIDIEGRANVNVNGQIKATNLNLVVGEKLTVRGTNEFNTTTVSADIVENNGKFIGKKIDMTAYHQLQNRFGGRLLADEINLSSTTGVVRNGSQYPFIPKDDLPLVLTPDTGHIDLGTINGIPFTNATKVNDLSAFIIGKNITISAVNNVENINPYFEYTLESINWDKGIPFNAEKTSQVQLVADDNLKIISNSFVLNSSAIMGVNNPTGEFTIISPYITNERYNTKVVVQPFSNTVSGNATTTTTGMEAALLVFSPPGVIYSFSKLGFYFNVVNGGFINNTAYFEVLNDATFTSIGDIETGKVTSIGLALQQQLQGKTVTKSMTTDECLAMIGQGAQSSQGRNYCLNNPIIKNTTNLAGTTEESMQGTLFSVSGSTYGVKAEFFGKNHLTIDEIQSEQINNYLTANSGQTGTVLKNGAYGGALYSFVQTASVVGDSLVIKRNFTKQSGTATFENTYTETVSSTSLTDWLTKVFSDLKEALTNMLRAFDDWFKHA